MKRIVMTMLLSLMVMSVSSFTYQTEYNYQRSTFGTTSNYISHNNTQSIEYRGIGYTTNYSNGQFNSTQYYQGTYNPSQNSSGGRHGGPRRSPSVPSYHDGEWDGWDILNGDAWRYYVTEGADKFWSQVDWSEPANYNNTSLQDLWRKDNPGKTPPWEQYLTPIGDNYIWFMVCMVSIYSLIKLKRNKLKHSAY